MFTGIVEDKCPVVGLDRGDDLIKLTVDLDELTEGVGLGDSIAVNGCCLTVEELDGPEVSFHAGRETLGLTNLGDLVLGSFVNIERSLAVGDKLGGHFVSGHVDGVGTVAAIEPEASQTWMSFDLPENLARQVLLKGSISLDGVSLTITEKKGSRVSVALIPHTLEVTTMGDYQVGDRINVETDMLGKWILERLDPILEEFGPKDSQE